MENARERLRTVRILATLTDTDLDRLAPRLTWRPVQAREEVVTHLDTGGVVYFAIEGTFSAKLESAVGRKVAIRQLQAGSHFGEIAALSSTPRSLAITAETDGLLAECPADALIELIHSNGSFAVAIATHLALTVVSLTDRVFELAALEVRFRIYAELLRLAAHGEQTAEGILVRNAPTHDVIAATTGTQREAVTREMRFLASEGVLRQEKRELLILDSERLRDQLHRRAGATTSEATDWRL
ncbi:MAG: Crp/Fnr family transcriptional regulator [Alphaproteobacteria bacterium]|nr:Crp/Fnr family transcriptional regulator [Alphaproteobacteria bacterium]